MKKDFLNFYITEKEYQIAARNGIPKCTLERRIRVQGWAKKKAMIMPVRKMPKKK